jgi:beta-phosphoglucomutase
MNAHTAGVIFDVDGVLVDSYHAHLKSWQWMCREWGLSITAEQFVATFGRTSREVIRELWGDRLTGDAQIAQLDQRKEALYREILSGDFPAMAGAVELIDQLHGDGFRLAIGSSAPPENVALTLDRLGRRGLFQGIVTGADVTRGKPDPQVFLLGAQRLGLAPSRCVVIEDAPLGVAAAHAAGMCAVAVVSTGRVREQAAAAELVVERLAELDPRRLRELLDGSRGERAAAANSVA